MTQYKAAGLSRAPTEGLMFNMKWGTKEMNHWLRGQFPRLFDHFAESFPDVMEIPNEADNSSDFPLSSFELPYLLLNQKSRHAQIVDVSHPTGADYEQTTFNHQLATRPAWNQKSIYLGTHFFSLQIKALILTIF